MTEEKTMFEIICEEIDKDPRMTHYTKEQLAIIEKAGVSKKEDRDRVLKENGMSIYSGPRKYIEEKKCSRCGACCRVLPLFTQHMHPDFKKYLLNLGLVEDKEQGCILIPHVCQHLKEVYEIGHEHTTCDIHDSSDRPHVCRVFHGQKIIKGSRVYIPPECSFAKEGP